MKHHRYAFALVIPLFLLVLAACGNNTKAGDTYGAPTGTSTEHASTAGTTVHTAEAMVNGKHVTLLTNAEGWTLYYFTPDTATTSACTTAPCNTTWPAFISKEGAPTSTATLPGKLGVQTNDNGSQVTYNGHPLYTYSKDTAAGQTNGEGVGGKWFVATTDLPALAESHATPPPSGSGYSY
jgi:predicted lipoprotein with Yx(FWY)xxD motif